MDEKLRSDLRQQFGHLVEVAEKTVAGLGEERAWQFTLLANDCIDLHNAILEAHPAEELRTSLVYHDFTGLFKEIRWCQLMLLAGNYPLLYRNLRFVWERVFRAHFADTFAAAYPGDPDQPGSFAGEKIEWLGAREGKLNWNTVVRPTLLAILPSNRHLDIESDYHMVWRHLSGYVHSSAELQLRMVDESALHILDNFDEQWATDSLKVSAEVFDLLWLAILSRFRVCVPLLKGLNPFLACPLARELVMQAKQPQQ